MRILNLNVNDFGGTDNHLQEYKQVYRWPMEAWDSIDKTKELNGIIRCVEKFEPDIVILEEYDINSREGKIFEIELEENDYLLETERSAYKRPSMTVFFVKKNLKHAYVNVGHTKNGRAYAIEVNGVIIYGTHIPPKFDRVFWDELHTFMKKISSKKYMLIGDFNTINHKNSQEMKEILKNAVDVWEAKGNAEPISVIGDYVVVSENMEIENIEIQRLDEKYSDHPVVCLTVGNRVFAGI